MTEREKHDRKTFRVWSKKTIHGVAHSLEMRVHPTKLPRALWVNGCRLAWQPIRLGWGYCQFFTILFKVLSRLPSLLSDRKSPDRRKYSRNLPKKVKMEILQLKSSCDWVWKISTIYHRFLSFLSLPLLFFISLIYVLFLEFSGVSIRGLLISSLWCKTVGGICQSDHISSEKKQNHPWRISLG